MGIKKASYGNWQRFANGLNEKFAKKSDLGALAALSEVGESNLAADLKAIINNKADAATTLAGYGITDGMTATEVASAISTAIAGADHLQRTIVEGVDSIDVSAENAEKYIYMVAKSEAADGDTYDEYMIVNGAVEKVGDWKVDLSDYATITKVTEMVAAALGAEVTGTGNVVTAIGYNAETGKLTVEKGITALQESDFEEFTDEEIDALLA